MLVHASAAPAPSAKSARDLAGHGPAPLAYDCTMNLAAIQEELRNQKLDGWLFFDHHLRDPLAYRVLGFEPPRTPTRRWYYLIPAEGEPRGLEHRIERNMTAPLPGEKIPYSSWTEQVEGLRKITAGVRRVAMVRSNTKRARRKLSQSSPQVRSPVYFNLLSSPAVVTTFHRGSRAAFPSANTCASSG